MKFSTGSRNILLILAANASLVVWSCASVPPAPRSASAVDHEAQRQRARQLLLDSQRGSDWALLRARAKAARRLFAAAGDPLGESLGWLTIASADVMMGDVEAAQAGFERALQMATASGDAIGVALVRLGEGAVWRAAGHHEKALFRLEEALQAFADLAGRGFRFTMDAFRYLVPQEFPPGYLEQTEPLLEILGPFLLQSLQSSALVEMAAVHREQGLHEEALRTLDRALVLPVTAAEGPQSILAQKAEIELALGRAERAMDLYEAALPLARKNGDVALQARILRGVADVHESAGRHEEASAFRGRAEALFPAGAAAPTCVMPNFARE